MGAFFVSPGKLPGNFSYLAWFHIVCGLEALRRDGVQSPALRYRA